MQFFYFDWTITSESFKHLFPIFSIFFEVFEMIKIYRIIISEWLYNTYCLILMKSRLQLFKTNPVSI